jgi:hypothetical protein
MAQQIIKGRRFEIDRAVRRKRRALIVARNAVFLSEPTSLRRIALSGFGARV